MLTKREVKALRVAIRAVVITEVNYSWRGGGDPADVPSIELERKLAKANLGLLLKILQMKDEE